jgi:hypothetical protein
MRSIFGVRQTIGWAWACVFLLPFAVLHAREQGGNNKKPSLSLKATPAVSFAPARVVMLAELRGGADLEAFYCPTVEWEWGDGTTSLAEADCTPYELGKSQIKRRYSVEHQYKNAGNFRVVLRLTKSSKLSGSANTTVQVRPGLTQQ